MTVFLCAGAHAPRRTGNSLSRSRLRVDTFSVEQVVPVPVQEGERESQEEAILELGGKGVSYRGATQAGTHNDLHSPEGWGPPARATPVSRWAPILPVSDMR